MPETSPLTQPAAVPAPTTPTEPSPSATTPTLSDTSLVNEKTPQTPEGAPESYSDFKFPEGFESNDEILNEAKGLFKDLNLAQGNAQRLIDLYSKVSQQSAEAPFKLWQETQQRWVDEVKASPDIGGKLDQVRSTISKAIDGLGDSKLAADFREAMDYTGAGNNPAFIRAFYALAQKVTEGGPISGNVPRAKPATAASAMYPNLPSGG